MMDLTEIYNNLADQEKGHEFELLTPETGEPTGIKMRIAGPDSQIARRARLKLVDDLADVADDYGKITAESREKARIASLAAYVLDWNLQEEGKALPCNQQNIIHILTNILWLQVQVDSFASDRLVYQKA